MNKKTLMDIDVKGKRVLARVDFNVPQDGEGKITDDTRIVSTLPTIKYLIAQGAKVILMSHLGRPKGVTPALTLAPVAAHLSQLLQQPVLMGPDAVGPAVESLVASLQSGQVLLLENLRFHPEEEKNTPEFARQLANLGELYVNDAFGTAHRAHASTEGVTHFLPAVAGFLLEKEIDYLGKALESPDRPFVALLGGAKVSDKIGVIANLIGIADTLLIGGGMANTFLKAQGYDVADSLVENDKIELARNLLDKAWQAAKPLHLPKDLVIANAFAKDAETQTIPTGNVPAGWRILDIGPVSAEEYGEIIKKAGTVLWNGTMGVTEFPDFAKSSRYIADILAAGKGKPTSIIGGGDTVGFVEGAGVAGAMSHVSTGGGASLEFLEGKTLPGVAALQDR